MTAFPTIFLAVAALWGLLGLVGIFRAEWTELALDLSAGTVFAALGSSAGRSGSTKG